MSEKLKTPNTKNYYEIQLKDMPICCPIPGTTLWDSHPRVYIAFNEKGQGNCPYCGAMYKVVD